MTNNIFPDCPICEEGVLVPFSFSEKGRPDSKIASLPLPYPSKDKKELEPGESTKISVNVANLGDTKGLKIVNLSINGDIVKSENIVLRPNENQRVFFEISEDEEGTFEISVNSLTGDFEVSKGKFPPKFEVSDLSIDKKTVDPEENVTVSVQVTKTGEKEGTYTVEISFDGETRTKDVFLNPDQSKKALFKISKEEAGTYTVSVERLAEEIKVKSAEEKELPLTWIGLGIGIIVALIAGIAIVKKA